jgi:FAD:protein FMN transferase
MPLALPAREMRPRSFPTEAALCGIPGAWLSRDEAIMGTAIRVELWSDDPTAGEAAIASVMAEMHRIDGAMSPYKSESELSRINRDAAGRPVPISEEMYRLLERAIQFSELSSGAFDITYAAAGHLYDYRRGVKPNDVALARATAMVGYQNLILNRAARTVRFARDGVRIDLGGFAKGYAVDNGAAILLRHGISHAIVTAGGDSHIVVAVLPLEDVAISTSGDYERFFEQDGVRFHHVIDPKTGESPRSMRSVTILAADGLTTEGLSKAVFVMGLERGMRLIESLSGVDAVVVDATGTLHFSSGLLHGGARPGGDTRQ